MAVTATAVAPSQTILNGTLPQTSVFELALAPTAPRAPNEAVSAADGRAILRFARTFEANLDAMVKPYYFPVPTEADLGNATLTTTAIGFFGIPLVVGLGLMAAGLDRYYTEVTLPLFVGCAALGPIAWVREAVSRHRLKHPRGTPLEAQSLRDAVSAESTSNPHARAVAAEILGVRLRDAGFVKAFDPEALEVVRELAEPRSARREVHQLIAVARFLNRGSVSNGQDLDTFNRLIADLPPDLAEVAREQGRALVLQPATTPGQ